LPPKLGPSVSLRFDFLTAKNFETHKGTNSKDVVAFHFLEQPQQRERERTGGFPDKSSE